MNEDKLELLQWIRNLNENGSLDDDTTARLVVEIVEDGLSSKPALPGQQASVGGCTWGHVAPVGH